jgi:hypothetical protein
MEQRDDTGTGRQGDAARKAWGVLSVVSCPLSVAERIKGRAKMIAALGFKSKETGQKRYYNFGFYSGF